MTLNAPKLRGPHFETAIIERYQRRESSVEESLIEMYLAGVSVHQIRLWCRKPFTFPNKPTEQT